MGALDPGQIAALKQQFPEYKTWTDSAIEHAFLAQSAEAQARPDDRTPETHSFWDKVSGAVVSLRDLATRGVARGLYAATSPAVQVARAAQGEPLGQIARNPETPAQSAPVNQLPIAAARQIVPQTPTDVALLAAGGPAGKYVSIVKRPLLSGAARIGSMAGVGAVASGATAAAQSDDPLTAAARGAGHGALAGIVGEVLNKFMRPDFNEERAIDALVKDAPALAPLRNGRDARQFMDAVAQYGHETARRPLQALDTRLTTALGGEDAVIPSRAAMKMDKLTSGMAAADAVVPSGAVPQPQLTPHAMPVSPIGQRNIQDALVDMQFQKQIERDTVKNVSVGDALELVKMAKLHKNPMMQRYGSELENEMLALSRDPALVNEYKGALADYRKSQNALDFVNDWYKFYPKNGPDAYALALGKNVRGQGRYGPSFTTDEMPALTEAVTGAPAGTTAIGEPASGGLHAYSRVLSAGGFHAGVPTIIGQRAAQPFRSVERAGAPRIRSLSEIAGAAASNAATEATGDFFGSME